MGTQDCVFCKTIEGLWNFDEVLIDLVPKVAEILQKLAPNPWRFGFGPVGPSL